MDTGSPVDREHASLREDFAGDLARLTSSLLGDSASASEIRELLRPLYVNSNAAAYLREFLPNDEELRQLVASAEEECLAALTAEEDAE